MRRSAAFDMLDRVAEERIAAHFALSTVAANWHEHLARASDVSAGLTIGTLRRCLDNSEITYVLRLFATFEAVLRDYWINGVGRTTDPDLKPLMDSVAARRNVDPATLAEAHRIRIFRNRIMHQNQKLLQFDYEDCASALAKFISWLPANW